MVVGAGILLMPVDVVSIKNSLNNYWNHSTTMALTSSSDPNLWPYHALKGPDTWKSHSDRSRLYGGCPNIAQLIEQISLGQCEQHQNGHCHDDTHHERAGMLSVFVNTKILEGVTVVLCIEDNVRVLKYQLVDYV